MSHTTIHYINVNHRQFDDSLVRQSDLDDDRFVYSQCPVFNHKSSRIFLGISPIDFKLRINRTSTHNHIACSDAKQLEGDDAHINSPRPVFQLKFPRYVFWSHDDNVMFVSTNIMEEEPVVNAINQIKDKFGGLHIAVNCAGTGYPGRILGKEAPHPLDAFQFIINLNLVGTFNLSLINI